MTTCLPTSPFFRMMARTGRRIGMASLVFGALVLTGCGGGGSDEPEADADGQAPAAAPPAPAKPSGPQPHVKIDNGITDSEALHTDRSVGNEVRRVP